MKSILDNTEVARALAGSREPAEPRSRAYAIQVLYALKRHAESLPCDLELVATDLDEIERNRLWEVLDYVVPAKMFTAELSDTGIANLQSLRRPGRG
jgi:hypothetical protein